MQHFTQKNYEKASDYFRKALDCDHTFEIAYDALCESLNRLNRIDEAFEYVSHWLNVNAHSPAAHMTLSRLYVQKGLKQEAMQEMEHYHRLKGLQT